MTAHWSRACRFPDDVLPASTDGDGDPIHHVAKLDSLDRQAQAQQARITFSHSSSRERDVPWQGCKWGMTKSP